MNSGKVSHHTTRSKVWLRVDFRPEPDVVEALSEIHRGSMVRRNGERFFEAPCSFNSIETLQALGFSISAPLMALYRTTLSPPALDPLPAPVVPQKLRKYQRQGVAFVDAKQGRALIADDMGLGKTIQALAYLALRPCRPVVVLCPACVKYNWEREVQTWLPDWSVLVLNGRSGEPLPYANIYILNYEILANQYQKKLGKKIEQRKTGWVDYLLARDPKCLIIDECHLLANPKTQRTKATERLGRKCSRVIGLSGTPFRNRPLEFYPIIRMIQPILFADRWDFIYQFTETTEQRVEAIGKARDHERLHQLLSRSIMIRRRKADVLKELPPKERSVVSLAPTSRSEGWREYQRAEENLITYLAREQGIEKALRAKKAEQLTQLAVLRRLAALAKLPQAKEWIDGCLDNDEKLIVFGFNTAVLHQIAGMYGTLAELIDGSVSAKKRQARVDRFQTQDSCRLLVGQFTAAGVGLNLTAASNVAFVQFPWTPADCDQCEDRAHRFGQKNKVHIWYLVGRGTIEERMMSLIDRKRQDFSAVVDGRSPDEGSMLLELLESYR